MNVDFEFSDRQLQTLEALADPKIKEVMYGGAKGGGKTVLGTRWVFLKCLELIKAFKLKKQAEIRNIPIAGFMGRKHAVDFSATTMLTWKREIPSEFYELRSIDGKVPVVVILNSIAVQYGGLDQEDEVKKLNSAEFAFYFIDQAEEVSEENAGMLRGTRRFKYAGMEPPGGYKGLYTTNPRQCWLKSEFVDEATRAPNVAYIQALPSDNPYLPQTYTDDLKQAFNNRPELLQAYLYGSWDDLTNQQTIIKQRWVEVATNHSGIKDGPELRVTVADIADGDNNGIDEDFIGDESGDETVIYDFVRGQLVDQEIYRNYDPMFTASRLVMHQKKNRSSVICVDSIGVGSGVFSRLRQVYSDERDVYIFGFDSRINPPGENNQRIYKNYKTYAWFTVAEEYFQPGKVSIPNDPELLRQLSNVPYTYSSNGKFTVLPKEKIKKILKVSPDRADACVMGLHALSKAQPEQFSGTKYYQRRTFNPMTI